MTDGIRVLLCSHTYFVLSCAPTWPLHTKLLLANNLIKLANDSSIINSYSGSVAMQVSKNLIAIAGGGGEGELKNFWVGMCHPCFQK